MERRKKYIWGCVLCALLTAVLIGMIYYYNDVRGKSCFDPCIIIILIKRFAKSFKYYIYYIDFKGEKI